MALWESRHRCGTKPGELNRRHAAIGASSTGAGLSRAGKSRLGGLWSEVRLPQLTDSDRGAARRLRAAADSTRAAGFCFPGRAAISGLPASPEADPHRRTGTSRTGTCGSSIAPMACRDRSRWQRQRSVDDGSTIARSTIAGTLRLRESGCATVVSRPMAASRSGSSARTRDFDLSGRARIRGTGRSQAPDRGVLSRESVNCVAVSTR